MSFIPIKIYTDPDAEKCERSYMSSVIEFAIENEDIMEVPMKILDTNRWSMICYKFVVPETKVYDIHLIGDLVFLKINDTVFDTTRTVLKLNKNDMIKVLTRKKGILDKCELIIIEI